MIFSGEVWNKNKKNNLLKLKKEEIEKGKCDLILYLIAIYRLSIFKITNPNKIKWGNRVILERLAYDKQLKYI